MSQVISNSLSYLGVNSTNPPKLTFQKRPPTSNDNRNFNIGDQWLVNNPLLAPSIQIWVLGSLAGSISGPSATWVEVYPAAGIGNLSFNTDNGVATAAGGVISLTDTDGNIIISGAGNVISYRMADNVFLIGSLNAGGSITAAGSLTATAGNVDFPMTTDNVNTGGYITQGGYSFIHSFGTNNTFVGAFSGAPGSMTVNSTDNTGIGYFSSAQLTDGSFNVAVGTGSLLAGTTANNNTAIGYQTLLNAFGVVDNCIMGWNSGSNLLTGNNNCIIGTGSGVGYVGSESDNLIIGNAILGTASESGVIRIGSSDQTTAYMSGVGGVAIAPGNVQMMVIDTVTGQMGSQAIAGGGGVNFTTTSGPTGTLTAATLTGAGGITITSAGSTITFTGGGGGGGSVNTLTGNTGGAVSPTGGGTINVVGSGTVSVTGNPGANTLTAAITGGTLNQVLQSAGAGNAAFSTATYPATSAQGDLLISSAANTYTNLAKDTNATRYLSNTGLGNNPAWALINLTNGVTGTLPVASGGTGKTTFTAYSVVTAGTTATGAFQNVVGLGTAGQALRSAGAGALPAWGDINLASDITGTLPVPNGGTGKTTFTAYSLVTAGTTATGVFQNVVGVGSAGQVLTSNGAAALPSWQASAVGGVNFTATTGGSTGTVNALTLSAGSNMTVTRSGSTITFASSSTGMTWNVDPVTNTVMVPDNGYLSVALGGATSNVRLPTVSAVGSMLALAVATGTTANFRITQAAGQVITVNSTTTTTGTGGSLSIGGYSGITLVCTIANTRWAALGTNGSISVT